MCPKLIELFSWNGPTVHVCCFMLARASTKTFVSRVQKTAENKIFVSRNIRQQGHSLAEVSLYIGNLSVYNIASGPRTEDERVVKWVRVLAAVGTMSKRYGAHWGPVRHKMGRDVQEQRYRPWSWRQTAHCGMLSLGLY